MSVPSALHDNDDSRRDQRGVTTLEAVLVAPAILLLIFASVQFALWYYSSSVARAAASEGAVAGSQSGASLDDAKQQATRVLEIGGELNAQTTISVSGTADAVEVTVHSHSPSLVLGLALPVSASATAPIESFRPESAGP